MAGESFRVDGYDLGSLASAGATGELWSATDSSTGQQVGLKRIRLRSPEQGGQLRQLVTLLGMIDHPHLQKILESKPMGDEVILVLQHAGRGSLEHLISGRGALDFGEVITTIGPIAQALEALHERGIVHGDLTPESIQYTMDEQPAMDGRPILVDAGMAPLLAGPETLTAHGYRDPAGESGPPSDVYAIAAISYAALTGIQAEPGTPRAPLKQVVPDLPEGLVHAVETGLQADPERRLPAGRFAEMLYNSGPAAPIRFPVGIALSDADIAAALAQAGTSPPPQPEQAAPNVAGEAAMPGQPQTPPAGQQPTLQPTPQDPFAYAMSQRNPQPNMFGPVPSAVEDDDEDDEPRSRVVLAVVLVLSFLLLAGAGVGGWWWWTNRDDPGSRSQGGGGTEPDGGSKEKGGTSEGAGKGEGGKGEKNGGGEKEEPPATPEERWTRELERLDEIRSQAFAQTDPSLLSQVYAPKAEEYLAADQQTIEGGTENGLRIEGLRYEIKSLTIADSGKRRMVLDVVDQLQPYNEVDADGFAQVRAGGDEQARRFTLVKADGTWLIEAIEATG